MKRSQLPLLIICCTSLAVILLASAVFAQDSHLARQQIAQLPSITPLFQGGQPQQIVPFGYQQAQPIAPGATAVPFQNVPSNATVQSAQTLAQPAAATLAATFPAGTTATTSTTDSDGIIAAIFNSVIVPIINFALDFINNTIASLWNSVGAQAGIVGQVLCCIGPGVLFAYWFLFRRSFGRRR